MLKTILIVDDRVINLEFLSMLLDYAGYQVTKASNGAEALELARATPPALVITDIVMPVMDGTELVRQLHIDPATAHIPVIFYTATYNANEADRVAQSLGVAAVLTKPAEPQKILDVVTAALGNTSLPSADTAPSPAMPPVVAALQQHVQQSLAIVAASPPDLSGQPAHTLGSMQTLSLRLAALLELSITLSAERDSQSLLALFCRAAQNIMNVTHAAVGMRDSGGMRRSGSCGLAGNDVDAIFDVLELGTSVLGQRFVGGNTLDIGDVKADPALRQLVAPHPLCSRFLVVPVKTGLHAQGWFYLAGKLGADDFDVEDQEFATTLAVQLAPLFDNLSLYEEVQQHVGRLETQALERQRVADKLLQSEAGLRRAQILTKSAHIVIGEDGVFESWSKTLPQLIGVTEADMPPTLQAWLALVDPADRARFTDCARAASDSGLRRELGYRVLRLSDGAVIELQQVLEPLWGLVDPDAKKRWFHTLQDVTEQKLQERKVARLSRISAVLSGINSAIVRIHDHHALFQEACRIAVNQGAFGMAWIGTIDPHTQNGQVLTCASASGKEAHVEKIRFATRVGMPDSENPWSVAVRELRPVMCNDIRTQAMPLHGNVLLGSGYQALAAFPLMLENRALAVMTLFSDETGIFDEEECKLLSDLAADLSFGLRFIDKEEKLSYLAYYDALTGLPNRMLFRDRLTQFLHAAKPDSGDTCVILLDLDQFSQLNDVLGRHAGDAVLLQVAERLRATLVEPYSLARIGGDIFAVAIPDLQQSGATLLEEQMFSIFNDVFVIDQQDIRITARAGLALYPDDGDDAETLFKHAEIALKKAKSSDERYLYYAPQMNAALAARLALKGELRLALDTRQFEMYYQPRVDLRSGRIVSAEALIRWQHPQRGMVPPDQFIPLAEETGLIVPIGAWVIDAVCAQQAAWLAQHVGIVPVAVNLSAVQFNKGVALKTIDDTIKRHGLDTKYIEFELTESIVMSDPEGATRNLQSLKKMGLKLALDDFGTGYSSLAYLKRFPFDFIKIDRAFITDITKSSKDAMIANAVIAMGHSLNMRIVAEGVETEAQLDYLRQHGCDEIQGYYFSRPVPAAAFEAMLRADKRLSFAR